MTTEPEAYTPPPPFPEAGYVVFGIPGVPYSSVRLPLVWDINQFNILVASAMESAKLVKEAYEEAFGEDVPTRQVQDAPQPRQEAPQRAQQGVQATGLFCPDHNVEVRPSAPQYQTYDMDENGNEVPAKYYHPLAENEQYRNQDGRQVKNHNLYRSQLVRAGG